MNRLEFNCVSDTRNNVSGTKRMATILFLALSQSVMRYPMCSLNIVDFSLFKDQKLFCFVFRKDKEEYVRLIFWICLYTIYLNYLNHLLKISGSAPEQYRLYYSKFRIRARKLDFIIKWLFIRWMDNPSLDNSPYCWMKDVKANNTKSVLHNVSLYLCMNNE